MNDAEDEQYQRIEWQGELVSYRRLSDGAYIPPDESNADFLALQARIANGYETVPSDTPAPLREDRL